MSVVSLNDECYFQCVEKKELKVVGAERIRSIIIASKERGDNLFVDLEAKLTNNPTATLTCHRDCLSTYTSKTHITRYLKRIRESATTTKEISLKQRLKRSDDFIFKIHCLFCGEACDDQFNYKHPNRNNRIVLCKTADRINKLPFKESILDICKKRFDKQSRQIEIRLQGAISDLHAADARYHYSCRNFLLHRDEDDRPFVEKAKLVDGIFECIIADILANENKIHNAVDLYESYIEKGEGSGMCKRSFLAKLKERLIGKYIFLVSSGYSTIMIEAKYAVSYLNLKCEKDEETLEISNVAQRIRNESKEACPSKSHYATRITKDKASENVSYTFLLLLAEITKTSVSELPLWSLLVANIISYQVNKTYTPLQISLGILLRERHLIEAFSTFGVCCSYDEIRLFRASAASSAQQDVKHRGISDARHGTIQSCSDNFDATIASQNGQKSTHALGIIVTQAKRVDTDNIENNIIRLKKEQIKDPPCDDIQLSIYEGPKKPAMPKNKSLYTVMPLKVICAQRISVQRAQNNDFEFLRTITDDPQAVEYGGFNTSKARNDGHTVQPKTVVAYLPLLDLPPADHTSMKTAMLEVQRITNGMGEEFTIHTNDQQLYKIAVEVLWVYPHIFPNFVPRLGGMHLAMSFIGCIGSLMKNSGIEEILSAAFSGVLKMLSGKKYPQNMRALRLLMEELLRDIIVSTDCFSNLLFELELRASKSLTVKHWLNNFIKPNLILMMHTRAEREGDWPLHLHAVEMMLPYFLAAGHWNYARWGAYYLENQKQLSPNVIQKFLKGDHVMRHNNGIWNGISSDQFIESTLMRYGHGPGGLIGITLKPSAVKKWALSLHTCSQLMQDVSSLQNSCSKSPVLFHKEETNSRQTADSNDRAQLQQKLQMTMHPLQPDSLPVGLVNVVTGEMSSENVNVAKALDHGLIQMTQYRKSWPDGFHSPLKSGIITMASTKKSIDVDGISVYDTELIYSRVIGLCATRQMNMMSVLSYELSPVPTSLFRENGTIRAATSKATLKNKLKIEIGSRTIPMPNATIVDGCAILWIITWPTSGTVLDYVENFTSYILNLLVSGDVYLVFDRYQDYSIKDTTRCNRQSVASSRLLQINESTPLPPQKVLLTSGKNKKQLIMLISTVLQQRVAGKKILNTLFITNSDPVPIKILNGKISTKPELRNTQEEADVIIVHQMLFAANNDGRTNIICDDTDVFLLLMHHYAKHELTCLVTMEATSHSRALIDVGRSAKEHEMIISKILAIHCLTGCDTTSGLYGLGKLKSFEAIKELSLTNIGEITSNFNEVLKESTKFFRNMYNSNGDTMTDIRKHVWAKKVSQKRSSAPKLKALPPTTEAFTEHVKRCHLQVAIWKHADRPDAPELNPIDWGYVRDTNSKRMVATTIPPGTLLAPPDVLQIIKCTCSRPCDTARCTCSKAGMPCTVFCNCQITSQLCLNKHTIPSITDDSTSDEDI